MKGLKNKYAIDVNALTIGNHTVDFSLEEDFFSLFSNEDIKKASCKAHVVIEKGNATCKANVSIVGSVTVECDRCVEDVTFDVDYSELLHIKISDAVEESSYDTDGDIDIIWVNPADSYIDLSQYLYDSIILSLPLQRMHGEDESGESLCNTEVLKLINFIEEDLFDDEEEDDLFDDEKDNK